MHKPIQERKPAEVKALVSLFK